MKHTGRRVTIVIGLVTLVVLAVTIVLGCRASSSTTASRRSGRTRKASGSTSTGRQLATIARNRPRSLSGLEEVQGFGKSRIDRFGKEVLEVLERGIVTESAPGESERKEGQR